MKGLIFYDATAMHRPWHCNICGRKHDDFEAWVYKEGDTILLFCGDTACCRDEFLEMNNLQDVEDINVTSMSLNKDEPPAYKTTMVVCRCPKCHEVVPLQLISEASSHILHIEVGEG